MVINYHRIGKRIRLSRREHGLTQEALAELASCSAAYISHIETGNTKVSLEVLCRIAHALNQTPDYFLLDTQLKSNYYLQREISEALQDCSVDTLHTAAKILTVLAEEEKIKDK